VDKVLKLLKETDALTEGHFLLSSGRHSGNYCQCAKLLRFPKKAEEALCAVAKQVKGLNLTKICGPAMGGIIVSYELSRQLGLESIFTERKDDEMTLRRGFAAGKGDRVLIAEDVVTTGKSTMETVKVLESLGAQVVGVACIVDRRNADCELKLPLYSAIKLDIASYDPLECPFCKEGIPIEKPGSRKNFGK
jgi:orotate phosphoribosyltransferase